MIDDHVMVRVALRMLIESRPGLVVVGEASQPAEALAVAGRERPDVILLDLTLGEDNGLDLLPNLHKVCDARVIVLTGMQDSDLHQRAVRLGAMGVVLKEQATSVLLDAIEKVASGAVWLDPALAARVLTDMTRARGAEQITPEVAKIARLTYREREVISLICEGLQNKQIGARMSISETTVRHHLTSIFDKLGVASRLELVIYAYRHGLATPPS